MLVAAKDIARHRRRNWLAFGGDYVAFGLGITFASISTTLPAFAATLTDNKVLIGAVPAVWVGGWLLPQLFAANYLSNKLRKYPVVMIGATIGRVSFPIFVAWLFLGGTAYPQLTLALLLVMLLYFASIDAVVALAWFDLFGKAMSPAERGRLTGICQALSGVLALGAGVWIQHLLGPQGPAYPANYATVFGLASIFFILSAAACGLIVEVREDVPEQRAALRDFLPHVAGLLRTDAAFSRVTLVRLLTGLGGLATPFYVVYAGEHLGLPPGSIGGFAAAGTVGVALAGLLFGPLAERAGSHRVVQVTSWVGLATPGLALAFQAGAFRSHEALVYPLLYVLMGLVEGSFILGFFNYILDIAPPGKRPVYVGLNNTLAGILVFVPPLGGFVLEHASYSVLFILAAAGVFVGCLLSMRMTRAPREAAPPLETSPHLPQVP